MTTRCINSRSLSLSLTLAMWACNGLFHNAAKLKDELTILCGSSLDERAPRTVLMMMYLILIPYSCAFQKYLVLPCTGPCNWISRIISRSCNVQPRRGIDSKTEIRYDSKVPKNILSQRLKFNILQCTVGLETAAAYAYQKSHHSRSY